MSGAAHELQPQYLVVTDLDGTVLLPKPQPESEMFPPYKANLEAVRQFTPAVETARAAGRLLFGPASGRAYRGVEEAYREQEEADAPLPESDFVIASVGFDVRVRNPQTDMLEALPNWPPEEVKEDWSLEQVMETMTAFTHLGIFEQEAEAQGPFKHSYYIKPEFTDQLLRENPQGIALLCFAIEQALREAEVPVRAAVTFSRSPNIPYDFLDIMPAGLDKGSAVLAVAKYFDVSPENIVVLTDSGNDYPMARVAGRTVVVGNAHKSYRTMLEQLPAGQIVLTVGRVAAGALEGLQQLDIV